MRNKIFKQNGFTLLELLIVISLIAIFLGLTYSILSMNNKTFNKSTENAFVQKDARIAAKLITKQLRNAKQVGIDKEQFKSVQKYYVIEQKKNISNPLYNLVMQTVESGVVVEEVSFGKEFKNISFMTNANSPGILNFSLEFENYTLSSAIKLNNINNLTIPEKTNKVYFSKYE